MQKGVLLVLLTAVISGASIFANSILAQPTDAFVFTALKNASVAVLIISIIFLSKNFQEIKSLTRRQWRNLALIGAIGGSIPFLLFFYALKLTSALNAAFLHKSMFLFVALLAAVFLKERLDKKFLIAILAMFAGIILLFGLKISSFGFPDLLILLAVVFWSIEVVLSKHVLKELSGNTVVFGRMFFGSLIMLSFLFATQRTELLFSLTTPQIAGIAITTLFLLAYNITWFNGLKHVNAAFAAAILSLGLPITAALSAVFQGKQLFLADFAGYAVIIAAVFALSYFSSKQRLSQPAAGVAQ